MFRSLITIRELVQSLAKVISLLKHSVKLHHYILVEMWQHVMEWRVCCLLCRLILFLRLVKDRNM